MEITCDHVCSSDCRRVGCHCRCGEFHQVVEEMDKSGWIEKEVAAKEALMPLDAHNKTVLRSMKEKEFNYWEKDAVRQDNHSAHEDY